MKRNWSIVREILEQIEKNSLRQYIQSGEYLQCPDIESDDDFFGHMEILIDAGIIRHASVERDAAGNFAGWDFRGVFITMQGHDLLDALRDEKVWTKIQTRAKKAGISLSWEFIKASIPIVIGELASGI